MTDVKTEEKPHYLGHRKRLKERLLQGGAGSLPDYELLEILLFSGNPRGDVKPLAKALIAAFGSFARALSAPSEALEKIPGMGETTIATLLAVREAALRLLKEEISKQPVLQNWKALLDYCRASMGYNKTEQFRILFLDKKNKLIADELQQEGTVDHTPVYPREVVRRTLELGASSIIVVHNHPSGDPTPSKADIEMTGKISHALAAVGCTLHDHVVIGAREHFSFAAHGML